MSGVLRETLQSSFAKVQASPGSSQLMLGYSHRMKMLSGHESVHLPVADRPSPGIVEPHKPKGVKYSVLLCFRPVFSAACRSRSTHFAARCYLGRNLQLGPELSSWDIYFTDSIFDHKSEHRFHICKRVSFSKQLSRSNQQN